MTSEEIYKAVWQLGYPSSVKYYVNNAFVFGNWESDFLTVGKNGYIKEYEVKVSRSDYFADFKKSIRRSVLKNGGYVRQRLKVPHEIDQTTGLLLMVDDKFVPYNRPNKFYFVVPEFLVKIEEVPEYAGLMYVIDGRIYEAKPAPFLHKEKIDKDKVLMNKYFWNWNTLRRDHEWYKASVTRAINTAIGAMKSGDIEGAINQLNYIKPKQS